MSLQDFLLRNDLATAATAGLMDARKHVVVSFQVTEKLNTATDDLYKPDPPIPTLSNEPVEDDGSFVTLTFPRSLTSPISTTGSLEDEFTSYPPDDDTDSEPESESGSEWESGSDEEAGAEPAEAAKDSGSDEGTISHSGSAESTPRRNNMCTEAVYDSTRGVVHLRRPEIEGRVSVPRTLVRHALISDWSGLDPSDPSRIMPSPDYVDSHCADEPYVWKFDVTLCVTVPFSEQDLAAKTAEVPRDRLFWPAHHDTSPESRRLAGITTSQRLNPRYFDLAKTMRDAFPGVLDAQTLVLVPETPVPAQSEPCTTFAISGSVNRKGTLHPARKSTGTQGSFDGAGRSPEASITGGATSNAGGDTSGVEGRMAARFAPNDNFYGWRGLAILGQLSAEVSGTRATGQRR